MKIDVNGIFDRLMSVHQIDSLKHLSIELGYKDNWGTSTRTRGTVPFEACLNTALEKGVSLDYLIFGIDNNQLTPANTKQIIDDALFTSHRLKFITVNPDADLDALSNFFVEKLLGQNISGVTSLGNKKAQ